MGFIDSVINYNLQTQEAQRQRKWNEDMWERQNKYNTPAAQMQRYRDAGLNPNLIYGQGTSGNAEKVQGYDRANPTINFNPMEILNQYQDLKVKKSNQNLIDANAELTEQRAKTEAFNTTLRQAQSIMSTDQYKDFRNQMMVKWGNQQLKFADTLSPEMPGVKSIIAKGNKDTADAIRSEATADIQTQMVKWLKANNMAKWIPLITGMLRFI